MELFKLVATLSLDISEYESKIAEAKKMIKTAGSAVQQAGKAAGQAAKAAGSTTQNAAKTAGSAVQQAAKTSASAAAGPTQKWKLFGKTVEDVGEKSFSKMSASAIAKGMLISNMIAGLIKSASRALVSFGKEAIQSSADIEAEKALYTQVFGEIEAAANGALESISKDTNILSTRLRGVGTKAFMQFKGAGLDATSALSAMDKYTRLAADAAAAYNISIEDADERLRSFLRGNTEAGDSIGLFTSEAQRNERAMQTYKKKWIDLTEAQKQMLMLGVVDELYNQQEIIGQASREGHEWENVLGNLKRSWSDLQGIIGGPFREALIPVMEKMTTFFSDETVQLRVGTFAASLGELAGKAFDGVISLIDTLLKLSNGEATSEKMDSAIGILGAIGEIATKTFEGVNSFLGWLFNADGIDENLSEFLRDMDTFFNSEGFQTAGTVIGSLIIAFLLLTSPIALVAGGLALIVTHWIGIKEWCGKAWTTVKNFFKTQYWDKISPIVDGIIGKLQGLWGWVVDVGNALANLFNIKVDPNFKGGTDYDPEVPDVSGGMGDYRYGWDNSYSTGRDNYGRSFATGLDYVPYNEYRARLHEGEAVLTKPEATIWRRGGMGASNVDAASIAQAVGEAVRAALDGTGVYMGADRVGDLVTERVSRNIAKSVKNRRYQPAW